MLGHLADLFTRRDGTFRQVDDIWTLFEDVHEEAEGVPSLQQGGLSQVYIVTPMSPAEHEMYVEGEMYVLKKTHKPIDKEESAMLREAFAREVDLLRLLKDDIDSEETTGEHMLTLHGAYEDETGWYTLCELADKGTLFQQQAWNARRSFSEKSCALVFSELLQAVHRCHALGVAHLDLKPENVMFTSVAKVKDGTLEKVGKLVEEASTDFREKTVGMEIDPVEAEAPVPNETALKKPGFLRLASSLYNKLLGKVTAGEEEEGAEAVEVEDFDPSLLSLRLIDLGSARRVKADESILVTSGTRSYCSPERLALWDALTNIPSLSKEEQEEAYAHQERYELSGAQLLASDVWALGVVLHVMVLGRRPFANERLDLLLTEQFEFPADAASSVLLQDLITRLLQKDWEKRITVTDALAHPFITKWEEQSEVDLGVRPALRRYESTGTVQKYAKISLSLSLTPYFYSSRLHFVSHT
jgi:serine/threonine protein kinase